MEEIIIIGAGAAGLTTAQILAKAGKTVLLLEARDRIGGRIFTFQGEGFSAPVEAGAEFMHGNLPFTTALMKEAGTTCYETAGQSWNVKKGRVQQGDLFPEGWDILMDKLRQLEHDMSMGEFLASYFADPKYEELTDAVKRLVQGYDAADITKISALALREEWENEENLTGYRLEGGYSRLMEFLMKDAQQHGAAFRLSTIVQEIRWEQGYAEVRTAQGDRYAAKKVIITVPANVLKTGAIQFTPPPSRHVKALQQIEVGGVIKFLIAFKEAFWEREEQAEFHSMPGLHFLFSDAPIPTWWTQKPSALPLLTGWLAGPVVHSMPPGDDALLQKAFHSLAYAFGCTEEQLQQWVKTSKVINWARDPFSLGAYAYKTLHTTAALKVLSESVEKTLYFAGEALYDGKEMGTVEAAIASGHNVVKQLIQDSASEKQDLPPIKDPDSSIHDPNTMINDPGSRVQDPSLLKSQKK